MLLDFGPGSVDAWLAWLVASELRISDEQSARYRESPDGARQRERIDLTPLSCRVYPRCLEAPELTQSRETLDDPVSTMPW
jgi:hypothetical protein